MLADKLHNKGYPVVVVEDTRARFEELAERGFPSVMGNAVAQDVLELARADCASALLLTIPNGYEAGEIVAKARAMNTHMTIKTNYADGCGFWFSGAASASGLRSMSCSERPSVSVSAAGLILTGQPNS